MSATPFRLQLRREIDFRTARRFRSRSYAAIYLTHRHIDIKELAMLKAAMAIGLLSVLGAASASAHEVGPGYRGYAPPPAYYHNARVPVPVYWNAPRAYAPVRYCPPKAHWKRYHSHYPKAAYYQGGKRGNWHGNDWHGNGSHGGNRGGHGH
jgi:hypothetical protein